MQRGRRWKAGRVGPHGRRQARPAAGPAAWIKRGACGSLPLAAAVRGAEYKRLTAQAWDEVAPRYHRRWAGIGAGPFAVTARIVRMAGIKRGDRVLDMACGTGAVTRRAATAVGPAGTVTGFDMSTSALRIARRFAAAPNAHFCIADAETVRFAGRFDAAVCQYALFYFPNSLAALRNARRMLKEGGSLAVAVHGDNAPFFTSILNAARRHMPGHDPPGAPDLNRFGTMRALRAEVERAGFEVVREESMTFRHSPGTFEDYKRGHLRYVAKAQRKKLAALPRAARKRFWDEVESNTAPYTDRGGRITFPWEVLAVAAAAPRRRRPNH